MSTTVPPISTTTTSVEPTHALPASGSTTAFAGTTSRWWPLELIEPSSSSPGTIDSVDVDRLKGLIATLPDLHVFTDSDQGHGWNEAAVHRQLEVLKEFFGNCHGTANGSNGSNGSHEPAHALVRNGTNGAAHGRSVLRDAVTLPAVHFLTG